MVNSLLACASDLTVTIIKILLIVFSRITPELVFSRITHPVMLYIKYSLLIKACSTRKNLSLNVILLRKTVNNNA